MRKRAFQPYPRAMLATGDAFSKGARILAGGASEDLKLWQPALVSLAFGLEVYFKCLLVIEGQALKTEHDLFTLFRMLSQQSQDYIRNDTQPGWGTMRAKFATLPPDRIPAGFTHDSGLDFALRTCRSLFTDVRYAYEREGKVTYRWLCEPVLQSARRRILMLLPGIDSQQRHKEPLAGDTPHVQ